MSTIQIRIDKKTKSEAKKVLDKIGLDMTSAIKIYLKQISEHKAIPFPLLTKNGMSIEEENVVMQAAQEARKGKNISKKMSSKEALEYLKN